MSHMPVKMRSLATHERLLLAHILEVTVSMTHHALTPLAPSFLADRSIKPLRFKSSKARTPLCSLLSALLTLTGVHQGASPGCENAGDSFYLSPIPILRIHLRIYIRRSGLGLGLADGRSVSDQCLRLGKYSGGESRCSNLSGFDARNGRTGV